jgi:hypothetical protein
VTTEVSDAEVDAALDVLRTAQDDPYEATLAEYAEARLQNGHTDAEDRTRELVREALRAAWTARRAVVVNRGEGP